MGPIILVSLHSMHERNTYMGCHVHLSVLLYDLQI
jgi:hypothetical protein